MFRTGKLIEHKHAELSNKAWPIVNRRKWNDVRVQGADSVPRKFVTHRSPIPVLDLIFFLFTVYKSYVETELSCRSLFSLFTINRVIMTELLVYSLFTDDAF